MIRKKIKTLMKFALDKVYHTFNLSEKRVFYDMEQDFNIFYEQTNEFTMTSRECMYSVYKSIF